MLKVSFGLTRSLNRLVGVFFATYLGVAPADAGLNSRPVQFSSGVNVTAQSASIDSSDADGHISFDFNILRKFKNSEFRIYLEGNTTHRGKSPGALFPETNSDLASAINSRNKGRFQVSELVYRHVGQTGRSFSLGLIDISGAFDQNAMANDENLYFLGAPFVLNQSIEFPDYALGIMFYRPFSKKYSLRAGLSSSAGISNNPNRSYTELLDVTDHGKGVFLIGEGAYSVGKFSSGIGVWTHTSDHALLNDPEASAHNYGVYALANYSAGATVFASRAGVANPDVSRIASELSLTITHSLHPLQAGLGVAVANFSDSPASQTPTRRDQFELYIRYDVSKAISLSGDVQLVRRSFRSSVGNELPVKASIFGVRLYWLKSWRR